jgi:hypothetical protein
VWRRRAPLEPKPYPAVSGTKKYLRAKSVVTMLDTCLANSVAWTLRGLHPNESSIGGDKFLSKAGAELAPWRSLRDH